MDSKREKDHHRTALWPTDALSKHKKKPLLRSEDRWGEKIKKGVGRDWIGRLRINGKKRGRDLSKGRESVLGRKR